MVSVDKHFWRRDIIFVNSNFLGWAGGGEGGGGRIGIRN
jgi:hypothetical protein